MKKEFLFTTALAAVSFAASNAWATASNAWDGKDFTNQTTHKVVTDNMEANDFTVSQNKNTGNGGGGAIYVQKPEVNNGYTPGSLTLNGGTFYHNHAKYDGGAIGNYGDLNINGTKFRNNTAQTEAKDNNSPIGGGALSLGIDSHTTIRGAEFTANLSGYNGGAIATRRTVESSKESKPLHHYLEIYDSTFLGNEVFDAKKGNGGGYGGAIATTFEGTKISGSTFVANQANKGGGAIYLTGLVKKNDSTLEDETHRGGTLLVENSNFLSNNALQGQGGAILTGTNSTSLDVNGSTFEGNSAKFGGGAIWSGSSTNIRNSTFKNNRTTATAYNNDDFSKDVESSNAEGGGALFVGSSSKVFIDGSTFENNASGTVGGAIATRGNSNGQKSSLTINRSTFKKNTSKVAGGALSIGSKDEGTVKGNELKITESDFNENSSKVGGAIYNRGEISIEKGSFKDNSSEGVGGAIVNSGGSLEVAGVTFSDNRATTDGGAIYNNKKGNKGNLKITGGLFKGNTAKGNGGAIFSGDDTEGLSVEDVTFESNSAKFGGAISLDGDKNTFAGNNIFKSNIAQDAGGALNIAGDGKVTFAENSVNVFEGNMSKDNKGNDINFGNNGSVEVAKGATLSLDGGITGGNGTLTLHNGSTLIVKDTTKVESDVKSQNTEPLGAIQVVVTDKTMQGQKLQLIGEDGIFTKDKLAENQSSMSLSPTDPMPRRYTYVESMFDQNANNLYQFEKEAGSNGVSYAVKERSSDEIADRLGVKEVEASTLLVASSSKTGSGRSDFDDVQNMLRHEAQYGKNSALLSRSADALGADAAPVVHTRETMLNNMIFDAANDALEDNASAMLVQSETNPLFEKVKLWAKGLFNRAEKNDTAKAHGFDIDTYGAAIGVDKVVGNGKVGLGYAYNHSDIDGYTRDTDVETHTAFVYGQYQPADWYVKGVAAYSWSDYEEDKSVLGHDAKAKYDVNTVALEGLYGYNIHTQNGYDITPETGLRYLRASQDAYTNALGVRVQDRDIDVVTAVAGMKVAKNFELSNNMNIRPEVHAALTYDLNTDDNDSVVYLPNGASYRVNGEKLERLGYEFGAKVSTDVTSQWEVGLGYDGRFRQDYQDHTGLVSVKYKF